MDNTQDIRTVVTDADARKDMQVEVYNNFEELKTIQQEWDDFIESVGGEIFLTYDWCRIWWKYYGKNRELRIFIFRINGNLVGIIPLFFEKLWLGPVFVRAAKIVGTDFTIAAVSIAVEPAFLADVIQQLRRLLDEYPLDIIYVGPIAGLYDNFENLSKACYELLLSSYYVETKSSGVQTYFCLAANWEEQLARLKKGQRWDIMRSYKALSSNTTPLVSTFASTDNFEQVFDNFVNMHQSYWRNLGKLGHFTDWPAAEEFHREVATAQLRQNRLRLLEVKSGSRYLGYEYDYRFGNRYFEFLNARSGLKEFAKISVGKVVFSEQLRKALSENVTCIDSMRGKYEHKLRLGGELFPIGSIYIVRKRFSVLARVFLFRALSRFLDICYYKIWYCRIAPKLPIKRRPLWKIWIRTQMFA